MKKSSLARRIFGFTLVELLVVIGIILILMGFVLAVIPMVKLHMQKLEAKNTANQASVAVNAYVTDYAKFPSLQSQGAPVPNSTGDAWVGDPAMGAQTHNNALFFSLRNIPKGPNEDYAVNPRKVVYFTPKAATVSAAGKPRGGSYDRTASGSIPPDDQFSNLYDPWGREYGVILDTTGDERINLEGIYSDFSGADPASGKAPRKTVGVFSSGKDELLGTKGDRVYRNGSDTSDDVISWE